jgi:hypothetical protein
MTIITRSELSTVFTSTRLLRAFEDLFAASASTVDVNGSLVNGGLIVTQLLPALNGQRVLQGGLGIGLVDGGAGNALVVRLLSTGVTPATYGANGRSLALAVDTTGRITAVAEYAGLYRIRVQAVTPPTSSQVVYEDIADIAYNLPTNLVGSSYGSAGTAATASYVFTLLRNGALFGTVTFAAGSTGTPTFVTTATTFAAGDLLTVQGQSTVDATLARVRIKIVGLI